MTTDAAERMRRLRERRKHGLRITPRAVISEEIIEAWTAAGIVSGPDDQEGLAATISELIEEYGLRFADEFCYSVTGSQIACED